MPQMNDPTLDRVGCRLRTVISGELLKDALHVILDRILCDAQLVRDLLVAESRRDQL